MHLELTARSVAQPIADGLSLGAKYDFDAFSPSSLPIPKTLSASSKRPVNQSTSFLINRIDSM